MHHGTIPGGARRTRSGLAKSVGESLPHQQGEPQAYPIWLPASKLFVYLTQKIIIKNEKKYHATKIAIQKLYLSYILYGIK